MCGEAPYVGKAKTKFRARFNNYKSTHRSYRKKRKVSRQRFHEHYQQHSHNGIEDWQFTLQYNPVKSDSQGTEKIGLT